MGNSSVPCQRTDTHQTQASGTSKANQPHMFIEHFLGTKSVLRLSLCVQSTGLSCSEAPQSASYRAHSNTKSHSTQHKGACFESVALENNMCGPAVNTNQSGCGLLHSTINGLHFPFSSTFYFNVFSSAFGSYCRSFLWDKKRGGLDGRDKNEFMPTIRRMHEIGTRLFMPPSPQGVTNAFDLLPSQ